MSGPGRTISTAGRYLAEFAGRHYSGQRNHIHKFRKLYPDAEYVPLTAADEPLLERFWQDYGAEFSKESAIAKNELRLAKEMLRHLSGRLVHGRGPAP